MSVTDKIDRLTAARDGIRTALAGQGVAAGDHGFEAFAADIATISRARVATTEARGDGGVELTFSVTGEPLVFTVYADSTVYASDNAIINVVDDGTDMINQYFDPTSNEAVRRQKNRGIATAYDPQSATFTLTSTTDRVWPEFAGYKLVYVY